MKPSDPVPRLRHLGLATAVGDGAADAAFGAQGENAGDGTVMTLTGGVGASYGHTALATAAGRGTGTVLTG